MKLLVAGLLLVALQYCHCKPYGIGFDGRLDGGLSLGYKDGTLRFGPDVGVKANAYLDPTSGPTAPIASPPPSSPYVYYPQAPYAYPSPTYGANQQPFYGYQPMYPQY